jgi:hypothetical protein
VGFATFFAGEEHMVTFVGTLMIGAVVGFMMEQQWGVEVVRWNRMRRMKTRILRRQSENPWKDGD